MRQRGWSQTSLARELDVSQPWVSQVISGKKDTGIAKAIKMLDCVGWELRISPKREDADPVKRREFVTGVASVALVPSPKTGPYQDPAYLRELARRVTHDRDEHGGAAIAPAAIRHIRRIEQVVESRDRELQAAASDLACETAWILIDARGLALAEKVGRLALELARSSWRADEQSQAYSVLAAINVDRGEVDRAIKYARLGMQVTGVSEVQQGWMRLRLGWTLGLVPGQVDAGRDILEDLRGSLAEVGGFSGQSAFDVAIMTGSVGCALNDVGSHGEAQTSLDAAVNLLGHSWPTPRAVYLTRQITAAFDVSQPALAADRMLTLARVVPLVNSPRIDSYVRQIAATSARWSAVPEVREAREQLRTVVVAK